MEWIEYWNCAEAWLSVNLDPTRVLGAWLAWAHNAPPSARRRFNGRAWWTEGGTYKLGDEPGAALEGQLVDLGGVPLLLAGLLRGRHGGGTVGREVNPGVASSRVTCRHFVQGAMRGPCGHGRKLWELGVGLFCSAGGCRASRLLENVGLQGVVWI
jgi:hypothetical protein